MIVTDVQWTDLGGILRSGYYMDNFLVENLHPTADFIKMDRDVVGIISGHGTVRNGKCLGKETKLKIKKDGKIIDSKEVGCYKNGEILNTISWDFEKNKTINSKSKIMRSNEKKKLYLVELENGKKIRCSIDHKLFIKRKFAGTDDKVIYKIIELKLKDIKIGDELVCQEK